jgi:hypothetical protein
MDKQDSFRYLARYIFDELEKARDNFRMQQRQPMGNKPADTSGSSFSYSPVSKIGSWPEMSNLECFHSSLWPGLLTTRQWIQGAAWLLRCLPGRNVERDVGEKPDRYE